MDEFSEDDGDDDELMMKVMMGANQLFAIKNQIFTITRMRNIRR